MGVEYECNFNSKQKSDYDNYTSTSKYYTSKSNHESKTMLTAASSCRPRNARARTCLRTRAARSSATMSSDEQKHKQETPQWR